MIALDETDRALIRALAQDATASAGALVSSTIAMPGRAALAMPSPAPASTAAPGPKSALSLAASPRRTCASAISRVGAPPGRSARVARAAASAGT